METKTASTPFLLLFRNTGPETHSHLSSEQRKQLITRWNAWYDELSAEGKAVGGSPLDESTSRVVSGAGGTRIIDGPFSEAKEVIGGYVLLMVSGREEALKIAQKHPGLLYGLDIEVRQMAENCHLGITARKQLTAAVSVH